MLFESLLLATMPSGFVINGWDSLGAAIIATILGLVLPTSPGHTARERQTPRWVAAISVLHQRVTGFLQLESSTTLAPWERGMEQQKGRILMHSLALTSGYFLAFWKGAPENVQVAAMGGSMLILLDTIFGVVCACIFQEFRSRKLRERLIAKFLYYGLFAIVSYILGAMLKAYWMMASAWYAIILIELASVMETLTRLHVRGGKKFGVAEKAIGFFAKAMGEAAKSSIPDEEPTGKLAKPKKEEETK